MSADDGFIELRLNRQDELAGENFWPSFTDIMTVVVMIFLMVMIVLVMYNQELVRDLQSSIEKERIARETARVTGEEKESIAVRLHAAESEVAELLARLRRNEELRGQQLTALERQSTTLEQQSKQLDEQAGRLSALTSERDDLRRRADRLTGEVQTAGAQLAASRQEATQLARSLATAQSRQEALEGELGALRTTTAEQRRELEQSREQLRQSTASLTSVQNEFGELRIKYDKLVRPARSPSGRYPVEVRYTKGGGGYQIRFREGDAGDYAEVSRERLDQRLAKLKADHPEGLYVRVVIPDGSGLSFSEAWEFTNHLHRNYDYYFQESAVGGETPR
jgi:Tfp pilus assembly protein PilO